MMKHSYGTDYTNIRQIFGFLFYAKVKLRVLGYSEEDIWTAFGKHPSSNLQEWVFQAFHLGAGVEVPVEVVDMFSSLENDRQLLRLSAEIVCDVHVHLAAYQYLRLFYTRSGFLGHAPYRMLATDEVCILHGCHVPVVLRRIGDQYQFVGACFLLGLMNGEAKEIRSDRALKVEEFELV